MKMGLSGKISCRESILVGILRGLWEHPDPPLVAQVNELVCRQAVPCLFADLSHGCHATQGPFHVPGEGACYACYRER